MFMQITLTCNSCPTTKEVSVTLAGWSQWREGTLIQIAFPHMSADDREMLISHTCPACWTKLFGADEEEESRMIDIPDDDMPEHAITIEEAIRRLKEQELEDAISRYENDNEPRTCASHDAINCSRCGNTM